MLAWIVTLWHLFLPVIILAANGDNSFPASNGLFKEINGLRAYESQTNTTSPVALIVVYDIFGFSPPVQYIADKLGGFGFRVVIPDFFHGEPFDPQNFPPSDLTHLNYIFKKDDGLWGNSTKADIQNIINNYKKDGVKKFGIFGFCWGGKIVAYATSDKELSDDIKAGGMVHPSRVATADAIAVRSPLILLPSGDEPDMIPFLEVLNKNLGYVNEHKRYFGFKHGFTGARSDFKNATIIAATDDVIDHLGKFFEKTLF